MPIYWKYLIYNEDSWQILVIMKQVTIDTIITGTMVVDMAAAIHMVDSVVTVANIKTYY